MNHWRWRVNIKEWCSTPNKKFSFEYRGRGTVEFTSKLDIFKPSRTGKCCIYRLRFVIAASSWETKVPDI